MSDTYRGFPVPEMILVDNYHWIIDDKFGQHWGYAPSVTMMSWRNSVDSAIIQDALEMDLIERIDDKEEYGCAECGLKIHDVFKHLEWHRKH